MLQIGTADTGHVFATEVNGWTGSSVHASLSRGRARAFTVYTHINAADRTVYSVDGRHVIDEEPWGPLTPLSGSGEGDRAVDVEEVRSRQGLDPAALRRLRAWVDRRPWGRG